MSKSPQGKIVVQVYGLQNFLLSTSTLMSKWFAALHCWRSFYLFISKNQEHKTFVSRSINQKTWNFWHCWLLGKFTIIWNSLHELSCCTSKCEHIAISLCGLIMDNVGYTTSSIHYSYLSLDSFTIYEYGRWWIHIHNFDILILEKNRWQDHTLPIVRDPTLNMTKMDKQAPIHINAWNNINAIFII